MNSVKPGIRCLQFVILLDFFSLITYMLHYILSISYVSQESWVLFLLLLCSLMMCTNNQVHYGPMVTFACLHFTLSHYHHHAGIYEGVELVKWWLDTFCQVCLRLNQFSQLSFMRYMGLCVFSIPISLMIVVRICVLYLVIIIKSELWLICHCLRLGHEIMVCTVHLSIIFLL